MKNTHFRFSVKAKQVSGTTDYLTVDLKTDLKIVGRIQPNTVWDYIKQIRENSTKEVLLIKFQPSSDDVEKDNYESFFSYLQNRNRYILHTKVQKIYLKHSRNSPPYYLNCKCFLLQVGCGFQREQDGQGLLRCAPRSW